MILAVGETNLDSLLAEMAPNLRDPVYVFVSLDGPLDAELRRASNLVMAFQEAEGWSLVLPAHDAAARGLSGVYPCRMITLTIASSLEAVGFIAAVSTALADAGISCNPVSAFHHDHVFVPADRADDAMAVLQALSAKVG